MASSIEARSSSTTPTTWPSSTLPILSKRLRRSTPRLTSRVRTPTPGGAKASIRCQSPQISGRTVARNDWVKYRVLRKAGSDEWTVGRLVEQLFGQPFMPCLPRTTRMTMINPAHWVSKARCVNSRVHSRTGIVVVWVEIFSVLIRIGSKTRWGGSRKEETLKN